MPSRDVNASTRLADASLRRDNVANEDRRAGGRKSLFHIIITRNNYIHTLSERVDVEKRIDHALTLYIAQTVKRWMGMYLIPWH